MNRPRISTGVERLDMLLDGGMPAGQAALVHGPRFTGKVALADSFALQGLAAGFPVVYIHTGCRGSEVRERLIEAGGDISAMEEAGLFWTVDAYSGVIGAEENPGNTRYVDGPLDLAGIAAAANEIQRGLQGDHDHHLIVFDSVSMLAAHGDAPSAFRFIHSLIGRARLAGATAMVLLDEGMHDEQHVMAFRHIMDGTIDTRRGDGKRQLRVLGLGATGLPGWVDYRIRDGRLELTGSFAAGRIR